MPFAMLSPEARLLLLSAGGAENDAQVRALLAGPLDWETLGALAARERAEPVLWERLCAASGGPLPPEALPLERLARVSEFRMLHLEQRLRESLEALGRERLEVLLLKGAALALTVYGSFVRRPMSDLDLLLRSGGGGGGAGGDASRARAVLLDAGWSTTELEARQEFFEGHQHLPALEDSRGTGVRIELHTALFFEGHPFRLSPADMWSRASPIIAFGRRAYVPSVHDQLLHLCLHFAWSHMMATGAWRTFRDMQMLMGTGRVSWDEFVALARTSRGASCCYWTFRLARTLSGVPVPNEVMAALRPPLPAFALERLERHFAANLLPTESVCPSVAMAYTMWQAGVRPRWSGHGRVRPWDRTDDLLFDERARMSGARRLMSHVRNASGWARYAKAVLKG
jgi:hypothetical protein